MATVKQLQLSLKRTTAKIQKLTKELAAIPLE